MEPHQEGRRTTSNIDGQTSAHLSMSVAHFVLLSQIFTLMSLKNLLSEVINMLLYICRVMELYNIASGEDTKQDSQK